MAAVQQTNTTTAKSCHCFGCGREGFKRRDLDKGFLCGHCRSTGVSGYKGLTKNRGLQSGTPAYWKKTKGQLNVITDDELNVITDERPPAASTRSGTRHTIEHYDEARAEFVVAYDGPALQERLGGTLKEWKADARKSALSSDQKLLLLTLGEHADWDGPTEGGNVFPSVSTLARMLAWPETRVRRTIGSVRGSWVTVCEVEDWRARARGVVRLSNRYILRWPDGRRLSAYDKRTVA